jgi:hypothetical protein
VEVALEVVTFVEFEAAVVEVEFNAIVLVVAEEDVVELLVPVKLLTNGS